MKQLIIALIILPAFCLAQEVKTADKPKIRKNEVGLTVGGDFGSDAFRSDFIPVSAAYYRNLKKAQLGFNLQCGIGNGPGMWYISSEVKANKIFLFKHQSLYAGGSTGYKWISWQHIAFIPKSSGFTMGLQAGTLIPLGKNLDLNFEAGLKLDQQATNIEMQRYEQGNLVNYTERYSYNEIYFPISIGMRYRF
jgi:hypothetical protein